MKKKTVIDKFYDEMKSAESDAYKEGYKRGLQDALSELEKAVNVLDGEVLNE